MTDWSPYFVPLVGNALACVVGIGLSVAAMVRTRRLLLLPLSVVVFLLTNAVFLWIPLVLNVGIAFPTDPVLYGRAAAAHAILVCVATLPLLTVVAAGRGNAATAARLPAWLPLGLAALALVSVGYLVARNPDVIPLSIAIYRTDSYGDYIDARNAAGDLLMSRRWSGNGLASLALAVYCPTALALMQFVPSFTAGVRRVLSAMLCLLMLVPAALSGSRMQLTFVVFYPLALLIQRKVDARSLTRKLQELMKSLVIGAVIVVAAVGIFQFVFQSTALVAAAIFLGRTFVDPGAVSGGYYLSFPDTFAFRGPAGIFMMPIASDVVDFRMVSLAATGLDSHANASFLATAWSAAGYAGVLVVSVVMVAGAWFTDLLLLRLPGRLASLLVFANIFAIMTLPGVPFAVAMVTHGYIIGPLGVVLALAAARQLAERPATVPGGSAAPA
jgi:hypothetical protein